MILALSPQDSTILLAAAFTAVVWIMVRAKMKRRTGNSSAGDRPATFAAAPRASDVKAMTDEMNRLLVDLQEAARRIAAQIDNRYQKLDAMLAEADEKIRRLEQLKREIEAASGGANAAHTMATPLPAASRGMPEDSQHRAVYDLADQGKNAREIAQQVGKQPGEIELILALRPRPVAT